jgi:O-antigen/teichoic acid export membrane protein
LGTAMIGVGFLLAWILIPIYGVMGATISYALTGTIYGVTTLFLSDIILSMKRRYLKLISVWGLFIICSSFVSLSYLFELKTLLRCIVVLFTFWAAFLFLTNESERIKLLKEVDNLKKKFSGNVK